MSNGILQGFLNRGLIDVGGDDTKLEKLAQAAKDLAGALKKNPSKALNYSLIAFDPDAPEGDPVVQEALAALQNRWTTYRNTFAATPIAVIRAILLDALVDAAEEDDRVGVCFVASARNALPLLPLDNERNIWASVVESVERRVDVRAEEEWATPETILIQPLKYEVPTLSAPEVTVGKASESSLRAGMRAAAGPQYQDPQQGHVATNGNQAWAHNAPHQWVAEFGSQSGKHIAAAINTAMASIEVSQPDLTGPFSALATAVSGYVDDTLKQVSAATAGLQRRTNLLWWREAMYSPSVGKSYRELTPSVAAALMAFDLFKAVPLFSPASVAAFLTEAVMHLQGVAGHDKRPVYDLVAEAQSHVELAPLRTVAAKLAAPPGGRGPLLALIGHSAHSDSQKEDEFQRLTGVPSDSALSAAAWAAWLFRELQASEATKGAVTAKRRSQKKG